MARRSQKNVVSVHAALKHQRICSQVKLSEKTHKIEIMQLKDQLALLNSDLNSERQLRLDAENQLATRRRQFEALGESIPFGTWRCDSQGLIDYASPSFFEFLGVERGRLNMLRILSSLTDKSRIADLKEKWRVCLTTGQVWHEELNLTGLDGAQASVLSWGYPKFSREGFIEGYSGLHLDISSRFNMECALRNSELLFQQLSDNLIDQGLWMGTVPDGKLIYFNSGLTRIWGVEEQTVKDQPFCLVEAVHAEDLGLVQSAIRKQLAGESTAIEYRIHRPDGQIRWVTERTFPVRNNLGRIYRVAGITSDVTALKMDQSKLKTAVLKSKQASQIKTQFLANMSHEIRTPLGAILGFADALLQKQDLTERDRTIEIIRRNGRQLLTIIDQILDISQVEADRLQTEKTPVNLGELVREVLELASLRAKAKGLGLSLRSSGCVPEFLLTDPTRLRQILTNLVGNAVKFTESGSVEVEIIGERIAMTNLHSLAIKVKDSGTPIPNEKRAKLFRPFTQADSSTRREFGGTGLGLALSKAFANALGGDLELEPLADKNLGNTFTVRLQVEAKTEFETQGHKIGNSLGLHNSRASKNLKGSRILVVDDSPDNRELIQMILESAGAVVECAESGFKCLEISDRDFDVVLMDIQMPGLDGYQTVGRLRENKIVKPVLALTAHAMKGEREKCLAAGFNDHLTKPIVRDNLLETIAKFLQAN